MATVEEVTKLALELDAYLMTEEREIEQAWVEEAKRRLADWEARKA